MGVGVLGRRFHRVAVALLSVAGVGFSLGAAAATFFPGLSLFFSSRAEMQSNVHDRARIAFHELGVRGTRAAWDTLRNTVIIGLSEGRPSEGLCEAIQQASDVLAEKMPGSHDDTNELDNPLRILD